MCNLTQKPSEVAQNTLSWVALTLTRLIFSSWKLPRSHTWREKDFKKTIMLFKEQLAQLFELTIQWKPANVWTPDSSPRPMLIVKASVTSLCIILITVKIWIGSAVVSRTRWRLNCLKTPALCTQKLAFSVCNSKDELKTIFQRTLWELNGRCGLAGNVCEPLAPAALRRRQVTHLRRQETEILIWAP